MANALIYYRQEKNEDVDKAIGNIKSIVRKLEMESLIRGVFIDVYNQRIKLEELFQSPLEEVDIVFIRSSEIDEFDNELINELSRSEQFQIRYLEDI